MTKLNKFGAAKTYFQRGHANWLIYLPWLITNVTIMYVLLGSEIPIIYQIFPNIVNFTLVFGVCYFTVAFTIGYFDIKRGTWRVESSVYFKNNPEWAALRREVKELRSLLLAIKGVDLSTEMLNEIKDLDVDDIFKVTDDEV